MCISWLLKSGWRFRGAVATVGVCVACVGTIITGDFWQPWQGKYYPGFGYTLVDVGPASLLVGQYKKLFLERGKSLGDLQNRYWSRFLNPQHVSLLVALEQLLYQLDTKVAIVKRERQAAGTLQPISQAVAKVNVDQLYEILQRIMATLDDAVDKKLVEMR